MGSSHNCTYLSHFAASVLNLTGRTDNFNCVRGPSLELGGRTPQVAGLTRTGGARVWSLRGTSWVEANHRTEGGGVICFRLVAFSGLESTSEANICSRGTKWDVTDKHDMSRWLAGVWKLKMKAIQLVC